MLIRCNEHVTIHHVTYLWSCKSDVFCVRKYPCHCRRKWNHMKVIGYGRICIVNTPESNYFLSPHAVTADVTVFPGFSALFLMNDLQTERSVFSRFSVLTQIVSFLGVFRQWADLAAHRLADVLGYCDPGWMTLQSTEMDHQVLLVAQRAHHLSKRKRWSRWVFIRPTKT